MYYLCIRLQINISVLFCSVLFSPGGGAFAILLWPWGLCISVPQGDPQACGTIVKATTSQEKNIQGQINMIIYLLLANHSQAWCHKIHV